MAPDREPDIDLGHDHKLWFFGWHPDRELNPQYETKPDIERAGATVGHKKSDGSDCLGGIWFDVPEAFELVGGRAVWQVQSWEPLTVSPSLLCHCGDHGFIREGKWVPA
jgi:hypothetical protein